MEKASVKLTVPTLHSGWDTLDQLIKVEVGSGRLALLHTYGGESDQIGVWYMRSGRRLMTFKTSYPPTMESPFYAARHAVTKLAERLVRDHVRPCV